MANLGRVVVGSAEAARLLDESERLREEYQRLDIATVGATGEALPPFPSH